jgi:hypothetical protein
MRWPDHNQCRGPKPVYVFPVERHAAVFLLKNIFLSDQSYCRHKVFPLAPVYIQSCRCNAILTAKRSQSALSNIIEGQTKQLRSALEPCYRAGLALPLYWKGLTLWADPSGPPACTEISLETAKALFSARWSTAYSAKETADYAEFLHVPCCKSIPVPESFCLFSLSEHNCHRTQGFATDYCPQNKR